MVDDVLLLDQPSRRRRHSPLERYRAIPLYLRILIAMGIGVAIGLLLGDRAEPFKWVSRVVLKILGALAPALILVAVMDSILNAKVGGRSAAKMAFLLILNTVVAILIGLAVANVVQPGKHQQVASAPAKRLQKRQISENNCSTISQRACLSHWSTIMSSVLYLSRSPLELPFADLQSQTTLRL